MSVKVAIRVRPFNEREKFLGCLCCVEMRENTTVLHETRGKQKKQHYFTFDYSFWSHDGYEVRGDGYMAPTSEGYIDQERVYDCIGRQMLANAWSGYNCCLFAYGQTGSGKSYSMIGYGANRGIIPLACQQIFQRISKYYSKGKREYELTLSMIEIYNEKVQDLFVPTSKRPPTGLKIRENKAIGVYVQGLTKHPVHSYSDIEQRMEEGSKNRSLASTLMNEYSSRAHTLVMIEFVQKQWISPLKMNKKTSFINLVDLAGSQRVSKTGIQGNKDRLKEASNINKSLHTLGRVIEILAQQATGKGKNLQVPYRDSCLTRILQGALGGNSKTVMICAISPANDNYEETLSTLRYADQTKKIRNKPIVNQSAVDKIIRQLREENERLKLMLKGGDSPFNEVNLLQEESKESRSNLRASMREVQNQIKKNLKSFAINTEVEEQDSMLMISEFIDLEDPSQMFTELSFDAGNKAQVFITNLNEDDLLCHKVRYSCEKDLLITNKNSKEIGIGMQNYAKIVLCGLGIEQHHATITKHNDKYYIQALSETAADYTLLNGQTVTKPRQLRHDDRIILGINSVFLFKNLREEGVQAESTKDKMPKDYQFAIDERQREMESMALVSPNALNLFLTGNTYKNLSQSQQQDPEVLERLNSIEAEFDKMVESNERQMRDKEDFYRDQLNQLRQEKYRQESEKSTLQEQLMIKTIESATLKSKNEELEKLKRKLAQFQNQKQKRLKARQSMLLEGDDSPTFSAQASPPLYTDLIVEEVDGAEQIVRDSLRESVGQSLLLPSEPLQEHHYHVKRENSPPKQLKVKFAFKRIYNIKIAWWDGSVSSEEEAQGLPGQHNDAPLQEFGYKRERKHISPSELAQLQEQILMLEQQLVQQKKMKPIEDPTRMSVEQEMLLNYSSSGQQTIPYERSNSLELAQLLDRKKPSEKSPLKAEVQQFIQVLADLPQLAIEHHLAENTVEPTVSPAPVLTHRRIIEVRQEPTLKQLTSIQMQTISLKPQVGTDKNESPQNCEKLPEMKTLKTEVAVQSEETIPEPQISAPKRVQLSISSLKNIYTYDTLPKRRKSLRLASSTLATALAPAEARNASESRAENVNQGIQTSDELIKLHAQSDKNIHDAITDRLQNLSFSAIENHDVSEQQISAMGLDGLLKGEDELNSKIQLLQARIHELESQESNSPPQTANTTTTEAESSPIPESDAVQTQTGPKNTAGAKIGRKRRRRKSVMTEQQRRQMEIERKLQGQLIQCNNQNLINERNLQIHKRKREGEELRKALVKREKVELQKQLLQLIPMVRRFNLIARQMKRLIEARITIDYRNFSHYQMIDILKGYHSKARTSNLNIRIVIFNLEEGRVYHWPQDVFSNRYQIAEQVFDKYAATQQSPARPDNQSDRAKDPFWDPADFLQQGVGYVSLQVLLYNLSYEGYVSLVYRSVVVAKVFVAVTPVKVVRKGEQDWEQESGQTLEEVEIFNMRNMLQKDIYFTVSIESIKFMQGEGGKTEQGKIDISQLNSNIMKYTISYELLEDDYKLNNYTTHQVQFQAEKQFKRIDYMRRHAFRRVSQSTLAYLSDCPIKLTLNVLKDYYPQCLNASLNESYSEDGLSLLDTSVDDKTSQRSFLTSQTSKTNDQKNNNSVQPSGFTKKPPAVIYENNQVMNRLNEDMKLVEQKRLQERRAAQSKQRKRREQNKSEKEKECVIY